MELLRQLYAIHSPSHGEKKMKKFIKSWIRRNVPDAIVVADHGNLYVTRGFADTYPCIVAHTDQVQTKHSKDFRCYMSDGKIYGFSVDDMEMQGLGADDKNGIWVALKCLAKYEVMKCAFFWGEEIGCAGSSDADMRFFKDCRWVVQCDRRNGGDLITDASFVELCSEEFVAALQPERFGYKETSGMMTDVMTLKEQGLAVSCVNMSCGYYRPHTDGEYTVWSELENCLAFVEWIVENVTGVYEHKVSHMAYGGYGDYYGYGNIGSGDYDDFYGYSKMTDDEVLDCIDSLKMSWPGMSDEELLEELRYYGTGRTDSDLKYMIQVVNDCVA